jgi:hypothetical protein
MIAGFSLFYTVAGCEDPVGINAIILFNYKSAVILFVTFLRKKVTQKAAGKLLPQFPGPERSGALIKL